MSEIPVEYLYFKPKDVASMVVDVASDILVADRDKNKDLAKDIMKHPEFLKRFEYISSLINKCGDDLVLHIKENKLENK